MKKIIKLSIIMLLIMIACSGIVQAVTPSCSISLEMTKSEFGKNDTFTVDVKLSNIVSEKGFVALKATLEYDKSSLTLLKMEGQNDWSNPVKDLSYNEATGKLVIDKNGFANSDEVILKLTFKVNENSQKNLMITLKNIEVSDSTVPTKLNTNAYKNITVTDGQDNPVPTPDPTPDPDPAPDSKPDKQPGSTSDDATQNSSQSQKPNKTQNTNTVDSLAKNKIPHAGTTSLILILLIAVISVVFFYFRIKKVNKQIDEE